MSTFSKIRKALPFPSLKALLPSQIRFPSRALQFFDSLDAPRATDLAREVGDGTSADVLMTPIRWKQRAMVEAPIVVRDAAGDPIDNNALTELLANPNPEYSFAVLMAGTTLSMDLDGNAYWLIARNVDGVPVELWYAPHPNMEPVWPQDRNDVFIGHYQYKVGGTVAKLEPEDVIHFREGVDLDNVRKGLSPLKGLLREVWTDNEAAIFTAALLRNGGIPGVVVSPVDKDVTITPEEAKATEARIETKFTRGGRGKTLVMTAATRVEQFGFSPKELDLSPLRDVSEERVTAALGIPAAVVGFGAGLQTTRVGATMRELRQLAWFNGVIPMQRVIAGEITRTLVPAFDGVASAEFDNIGVQALRENEDTKAARLGRLYRDGLISRSEGRTPLGFESTPEDDVYSVPMTTTLLPQGAAAPELGNGNGNGKGRIGVDYFLTKSGVLVHKEHTHDPTEERIIAAAPSAKPTAVAARMANRLDRIRARAPGILAALVADVFEELGAVAFTAASAEIEAIDIETASDGRPTQIKRDELLPEDVALLAQIIDTVDTDAAQLLLAEAFERGFLQIAEQVSGAIGDTFGFAFELNDVAQGNVMRAGGLQAGLIDLDQQTRDAIFDALATGRAEGLVGDALARHIAEHVEAGPWSDAATRAQVIARTEGANAANVSTLEAARSMPETQHVQIFDNRTGFGDDACVAADGVVVTIDEADAMGLAHPNCLPGSAVVLAPNLHATLTRRFDGELVVLRTADDDLLSCTPNHPILTDHGWVAAEALREGDYVIRCLDSERVAGLLDPDNDQVPTLVEDVERAFMVAPGVTTARVPGAAEHFHGDGREDHITVVRSDGFLERAAAEHHQQLAVVGADVELVGLDSASSLAFDREGIGHASAGGLRGSCELSALGARVPRHVESLGLRQGSNRKAALFEVSSKRARSNPCGLGDDGAALSGLVAPVQIVKVERRQFAGQVFNLETGQGWYVADGIITHNCTRSFVPINALLMEEMGL